MKQAAALFLLIATGISLVLFSVEYEVQALEQELTAIERGIQDDRRAVHVLKAEWSLLTRPDRLRPLAEKHLALEPVSPDQIGTLAGLPMRPDEDAALAEEDGEDGIVSDDPVLRLTATRPWDEEPAHD